MVDAWMSLDEEVDVIRKIDFGMYFTAYMSEASGATIPRVGLVL
jgi:hypothetical protein